MRSIAFDVTGWGTRLFILLLFFLTGSFCTQAHADDVVVRVKIERTAWFGCDDGVLGPPDVYFRVNIDGDELNSRGSTIFTNFSPFNVNREFSQNVDFAAGTIDITIAQWDRDGTILTGDDDHCDISDSGNDIELSLDLAACTISGELSGNCGETLVSRGNFEFQINVDEPPSAPGLQTACLHTPLWPQPGETVDITANSLDGTLASRLADSIEIWVDDRTAPASASPGTSATYTAGPFGDASTFTYGCRVIDDGLTIWTGWRTVAIGTSDITAGYGNRIPVLYTGERSSHLDMVFYPDVDSYPGPTDPAFQLDVFNAIQNAYFAEDVFLANQDKMNYWIALDTGRADGFVDGDCGLDANQRAWEDTGIVFHTDTLRDCAPGGKRLFSSEPTSYRTIIHETGHRPFGMADEYCCDGGYFQTSPFPNIYNTLPSIPIGTTGVTLLGCAEDAVSVGRTASSCRTWDETVPWWFDEDWYTSDPASNDLMVDNTTRQALDNRRINWLFDVCRAAGC